jgi:hypothetical protein
MPRLKQVFGEYAQTVACSAALLWSVHPLQTESVTYISQRAMSMMGLFFLLALYALIRAGDERTPVSRAWAWHTLAIASALLGAACQRTIATLPLFALLYDRCFISENWRGALKRAPGLYAGLLLATWPMILIFSLMAPNGQSAPATFRSAPMPFGDYVQTQFVVLVHYLKLSFWPANQCIDYMWLPESDWSRILPCAVFILGLLALTAWQLLRNTAVGLCGAWFFLVLAPTSSLLPSTVPAAERRMYLPLAALCVLVVCAVYRMLSRFLDTATAPRVLIDIALVVGVGLCTLTAFRNTLYYDELSMQRDILETRPLHPRALVFVANYDWGRGWYTQAADGYRAAIKLLPANDPLAHGATERLEAFESGQPQNKP